MLIVDNYDSFTYNIVEYVKMLGVSPIVIKNNQLTFDEIKSLEFSRIIVSPGWGNPFNSGVSMDLISYYANRKPIFGICLRMQCIAKYFGANVVKASKPCHGKCSRIYFKERFPLFFGLKQGFLAVRYHSLVVNGYSGTEIQPMAFCDDNILMAFQIKDKNIFGVQFHPEAYLTEFGLKIFENFLMIS